VFRPTAAQPLAQPFKQPNIPGIPSHQTDTVFGCTGREGGWNDPPPAKESNSGETTSKSTSRISKLRNPKKNTTPATPQQPAFTPATFTPQAIQPGKMMQNAPPMSQNGFPGFTTEQERVLENERQTRQAFEMAAGPPSKDIRSRLSSKASGRSEEFNAAPIQNLSESDLKMKAIFTRLLQSTKAHPNLQPQFRKKLDNVDKGLQIFYQKLSEGSISLNTVTSIQQVASLSEQQNYQAAIGLHRKIVQNANFSQISAFMPGIKILLTIAATLRIQI
jgi:protein transport protein SEC31